MRIVSKWKTIATKIGSNKRSAFEHGAIRETMKRKVIDLRSDTVTLPSSQMRAAMAKAEVGDDVYGEDPTVNLLEEKAARKLGKEASIFVGSGTQSNLLALLCHCERGDEYLVGQKAHTYKYEAGGAAVLGSIQPQPVEFESDGRLDLEKAAHYVKPDDIHFTRTKLLCLENTYWGNALPMDYLKEAEVFGKKHRINLHLDGARLFNAAVHQKVSAAEISQYFHSVSVCLSKGLGAPIGSVLCGNSEFVARARRWRKMLGGGMRQAGIVAAAGIVALEEGPQRLYRDHENARLLAQGLSDISRISVDSMRMQTNMVFLYASDSDIAELSRFLQERGILVGSGNPIRMVAHLDVTAEDIEAAVAAIRKFFQ